MSEQQIISLVVLSIYITSPFAFIGAVIYLVVRDMISEQKSNKENEQEELNNEK